MVCSLRMQMSKDLSCSSDTSPDSKSWSDFLSPPTFPTCFLFFLSKLLSLSLSLRCYNSSREISSIGSLKWRYSSCISPSSGSDSWRICNTLMPQKEKQKMNRDMLSPCCIPQRKCSLVCMTLTLVSLKTKAFSS